jgi:hypothetical protein
VVSLFGDDEELMSRQLISIEMKLVDERAMDYDEIMMMGLRRN